METKTPAIENLDPSLRNIPSREPAKKNDEIGKNEFLTLLVTQLKNQDPLDPLKSDDFAVNLAQFSQVEQLVSIKEALSNENGATDFSTMAAYLGNEVVLSGESLSVQGGNGGSLQVGLEGDASSVTLEFLDESGSVVGTHDLGALEKGKHLVNLDGLNVTSGEYGFRVRATDSSGFQQGATARLAGLVNGFIPGPDPVLIVNGKEVSPSEVVEVAVPSE